MVTSSERNRRVSHDDYVALASFRHALRKFLNFSALAAHEEGLSPQQHQALLAVKGGGNGETLSIGELAERLYLRHHSAVGLVDRLAKKKLLQRSNARDDRRRVLVSLTTQGEALINRLSAAHREELKRIGPELRRWLETLDRSEEI